MLLTAMWSFLESPQLDNAAKSDFPIREEGKCQGYNNIMCGDQIFHPPK